MTSTILAAFPTSSAPVCTTATPTRQELLFQSSASPGILCYFSNYTISSHTVSEFNGLLYALHHW